MDLLALHSKSLDKCYIACKESMQLLEFRQKVVVMQAVQKHISDLSKAGVSKVVAAFKKGDMLTSLVELNAFLEQGAVKQVILSMMKDLKTAYKGYKDDINKIVSCYFSKCDEEAIQITFNIVKIITNIYALIDNKEVIKISNEIKAIMKDNLAHAHKLMEDGLSRSKVTNTTKKRKAKTPKK